MDAGVVDQNVHRSDRRGETKRRIRVVDIERNRADVAAEAARSRIALVVVARAEEHPPAARAELAADLEPDAAIGPGDQRDAPHDFARHGHRPLARSAATATRPRSPISCVMTKVMAVTLQPSSILRRVQR